jgi:hypothetical protein
VADEGGDPSEQAVIGGDAARVEAADIEDPALSYLHALYP